MTPNILRTTAGAWLGTLALLAGATVQANTPFADESAEDNQVLEWNQVFVDTLVATSTPNSSSQRLGAIVHTAIFDAYNGIERRYTPIFVDPRASHGASRRAAVIAAAYTALVGLFPTRRADLDARYAASLAALSDDGGSWRIPLSLGNRACAVSRGERRWPKRYSLGVRPMASVSATRLFRWDGGRAMAAGAAGNRDERRSARFHCNVRPSNQ